MARSPASNCLPLRSGGTSSTISQDPGSDTREVLCPQPPIRDFEIGKGYWLKQGTDITFIASGPIIIQPLMVAQSVGESIIVIDMPTIVPVDEDIIVEAAKLSRKIVTPRNHDRNGGIKDEVAGVIGLWRSRVESDFVATHDLTESGSAKDLYAKYGLSENRIIEKFNLTCKHRASD